MAEVPAREHIEQWKRCLLDLPDELFFSIMRTYLGELKTPFHKPRLADRIVHLFSKEETIQRAVALIDAHDTLVLTAIDLLDRPTPQQLLRLFHDSYDYFSIHNHLMNLRERLLIYSCSDSPLLHINPFLHQPIRETVLSPAALFPPATQVKTKTNPAIRVTEEICWSFIAALHSYNDPLKADGTLKKRISEGLQSIFTSHSENYDLSIYYLLINALLKLGILQRHRAGFTLDYQRGTAFGRKSRSDRLFFLWAAACTSSDEAVEDFSLTSLALQQLAHIAGSISRFYALIPSGYSFDQSSLIRMLIAADRPPSEKTAADPIDPKKIILTLSKIGVLAGNSKRLYRNPSAADLFHAQEETQALLLHPDFTITVKPPLPFETGLFISEVLELRAFAAYPQFELSRASYLHGRRRFDFETIRERITKMSATTLPQNIRFSLESWENHYSSVVMIEGITLSLAGHWDQMVRSHPDFFTYILKDFGNGIYVMDAAHRRKWQSLLEEIGITPLPAVEGRDRSSSDANTASEIAFPDLPEQVSNSDGAVERFTSPAPGAGIKIADEQILNELRRELDRLPPNKAKDKKELEAQIEKKLFLFPSQLHNSQISPSLNEARGMNYSGKVRIIQQSLQSEWDLLELVERTSSGKPQRHLIRPKELQKSGNELLLIGEKLPDNSELQVWVQKIGYIKKWKSSLFVQPKDYSP
ncbi:MAG: hypothetical protein ACOCW5_00455 [Spirochaetia bacterium]